MKDGPAAGLICRPPRQLVSLGIEPGRDQRNEGCHVRIGDGGCEFVIILFFFCSVGFDLQTIKLVAQITQTKKMEVFWSNVHE